MKFKDICFDIPTNQTFNFDRIKITNSSHLLSFVDSWSPPLIYYPYGSVLCGPMLKILEEISKRLGYNILRIKYPSDKTDYFNILLSDKWRLVLHPITSILIEKTLESLDYTRFGCLSRALGMQSNDFISSIAIPRKRHSFEFIFGFEVPVWITLFLTILFIPLSFALIEKSFSGYFKNLWNYSYLILSETIPRMPKSSMKRFILTFWLLACTVLLPGYSGVLRKSFMKANPDDVIESWKQLYARKDMKILTIEGSALDIFTQSYRNENEMARNFASRLETIKFGDNEDLTSIVFEKLFAGYAVSYPEYILEDCYYFASNISIDKTKECDKIHVSKQDSSDWPYFMLISRFMSNKDTKALNKVIQISQESGLYDEWTAVAQKLRTSYNPEFKKNRNEKYQSETLTFSRMQGVFIIWFVGSLLSIPMIVFEIFYYLIKN